MWIDFMTSCVSTLLYSCYDLLSYDFFTTVIIATVMSRLVKVSIVGTAGRKEDGKKMTKEIYHLMYEKAKDIIVNKFKLELSQCHVVSGGAAWAGRIYLLILFKVHSD